MAHVDQEPEIGQRELVPDSRVRNWADLLATRLTPHRFLANQLRRPSGAFGRWVMAPSLNKANRDLITEAFRELDLKTDASCLDIGFGGGLLLQLASDRTKGALWGADFSPDVVAAGRRSMAKLIKSGQLNLVTADVKSLPLRHSMVDAVTAINTVYFWPDLRAAFSEIQRVLRPGGTLVVAYTGREKMQAFQNIAQHGFHPVMPSDVESALEETDFDRIRTVALTGPVTEGDFVTLAHG